MPLEPWTKLPRRLASLAATLVLDRHGAACWLLARASHAPTEVPGWGGIQAGQVVVSTRQLADEWGVGHHAARNILADLCAAGLCSVAEHRDGVRGGTLLDVSGTFSGTFSGTLANRTQTAGNNRYDACIKPTSGHVSGHIDGRIPVRAPARTLVVPENNREKKEKERNPQQPRHYSPTDPLLWDWLDRLKTEGAKK
ncbi:MAG: hypothetical protein J5654_04930 [Victivallales bacterium]|nr:hypothetical protein [Victivallales bacterium]